MSFLNFLSFSLNFFRKIFSVLCYQRSHNKLYKHFFAFSCRLRFYNFLFRWFVVELTPQKLFQHIWIHTKSFSDSRGKTLKSERPIIKSGGKSYISFFRWIKMFLFLCFDVFRRHSLLFFSNKVTLNKLSQYSISVFYYLLKLKVNLICVHIFFNHQTV